MGTKFLLILAKATTSTAAWKQSFAHFDKALQQWKTDLTKYTQVVQHRDKAWLTLTKAVGKKALLTLNEALQHTEFGFVYFDLLPARHHSNKAVLTLTKHCSLGTKHCSLCNQSFAHLTTALQCKNQSFTHFDLDPLQQYEQCPGHLNQSIVPQERAIWPVFSSRFCCSYMAQRSSSLFLK